MTSEPSKTAVLGSQFATALETRGEPEPKKCPLVVFGIVPRHAPFSYWPIFSPVPRKYSRLPITRTFKGNRKRFKLSGVPVIGSSKKVARSKEKNCFYRIVTILITFNWRNVKRKLKDTSRL